MLSYNILNDFVEKLKSGNVTPDDLVKVGNAVKDADLQVKYEVENIKAIPSDILNEVKCCDVIAKKTGEQYHCYIVTYKQENAGICLTYFDASVVETQSYDYVTDAWVYNSEDKTVIIYTGGTGINVNNGQISADTTVLQEKLTAGNGIDITGNVVSSTAAAVYTHHITVGANFTNKYASVRLNIENTSNEAFTMQTLATWLYNNNHTDQAKSIICNGIIGNRTVTSEGTIWNWAYAQDLYSNGSQIYIDGYKGLDDINDATVPTKYTVNDTQWTVTDIID